MDSFNKTNNFKVLVEVFESKYQFIINECHQKWPKLKESIEDRINLMIGEKIDFKNHLFEVFDDSSKTFIELDQNVYNHFICLPKIHVLVKNRGIFKRKPNENQLKDWKNVITSEAIDSHLNDFNLLIPNERQKSELLLAKTVSELRVDSEMVWISVSQKLTTNGYNEWTPNHCRKQFSKLINKYVTHLSNYETYSEAAKNWSPFNYMNAIDSEKLKKLVKKKTINKIEIFRQKFSSKKSKNSVNCVSNGVQNLENFCLMESRFSTEAKLIPVRKSVSNSEIDWFMNSTLKP